MKLMMEWNLPMLELAGTSQPKAVECPQTLDDRGYNFFIVNDYVVSQTDIAHLTNSTDHFDIFMKKPLMPTEDLGIDLIEGATHGTSQKSTIHLERKEDL